MAPNEKTDSAEKDRGERSDQAGQMQERRRLAAALRDKGSNPFANDAPISHQIYELPASEAAAVLGLPQDSELNDAHSRYAVAGRLLQVNDMGKAKFLFLRGDRGAMLQLYLRAEQAEAFALS